jgi:phenylacetate-coenzyme A ligase PaaK-like adenylate-forming protein
VDQFIEKHLVHNAMKISPLEEWIVRKISCPQIELSRGQIVDYQLRKINETLGNAIENSRFYSTLLAGFPSHFKSLEEFSKIPFTTSCDIRDYPNNFLCVSQSSISRIVTLNTTGTTGLPKRCFFTPEDQELTVDFFGVGMSTLVEAGDRVLILLPGEAPGSVGDLLHAGLTRIEVHAFKYGPVLDPGDTLSRIVELDINCLVGVPSQVMALVQFSRIHKHKYPIHMKSILLSTDYVPDAIVNAIKSAWDCEVFNHYGMTEMGLGGGVFCAAQFGYHLREADMYFEIIDPINGRILPDGEEGEIVFTTLTRQGMPLIRYRTGDISRFLPGKCPCGTILKTMERIKGRITQKVKIGPEYFSIGDFDEALFQIGGLINYQCEVVHGQPNNQILLKLFTLQVDELLKEKVIDAIHRMNSLMTNVDVFVSVENGYTSDLGSMKKRQIIEKTLED